MIIMFDNARIYKTKKVKLFVRKLEWVVSKIR